MTSQDHSALNSHNDGPTTRVQICWTHSWGTRHWDLRERRGGKLDPEWANRRRLLTARERLSNKSFVKMWNEINDADPTAQILSAWIAC